MDYLLAVVRPLRELIGPVHPINARIHVVFVASANLQDAGNPVVVRLLPRAHRFVVVGGFLSLNARVVCDVDETLTEVFYSIDCATIVSATVVGCARRGLG